MCSLIILLSNVRQSIELFQMVAHGVDILPASHGIGVDARMGREPWDPFHMRS